MIKQWIIGGGLIVLLGCTYPIQANDSNEISIFKAGAIIFSTFYNPDGKGIEVRATLADQEDHTVGEIRVTTLLPSIIKQNLFSPTTLNPFKSAYAVFYTPTAFKQLQRCPFMGIEFDLDNNRKTQEWYIATSTVGCVKNQSYIDGATGHNWILQKTETGLFRVLMESESPLYSNKANSKKGSYKPLDTFHHVMRFNPGSKLGCGAVRIDWTYNPTKQQYQMGKTYLQQSNCPSPGTNIQRLMTRIKGEIDPWMNKNLKAFR
ncbi:hypothetical protein [Thiofilum flexile]|uniref:hypothetical protein n=1 Tax=Thiofilum flexile TaxID=125627 RepID=UPI000379B27F|nr:hypothetical protein [Thiofilum flexile]